MGNRDVRMDSTKAESRAAPSERTAPRAGLRHMLAELLRRGTIPLEPLLRPYSLMVIPLVLSAAAWSLPLGAGVRRGFTIREPVTLRAVLLLVAWYLLIAALAAAGFHLGQRMRPISRFASFPRKLWYRYFTLAAFLGVVYSYGLNVAKDPHSVAEALRHANFNLLRYGLGYTAGPQSLRYAAIVSGGVAIWEILGKRSFRLLHFLNLGLLFAASALASRLSLVLATLLAIALAAHERRARLSLPYALAIAVALFVLTTPLNYLRNSGFYSREYHVSNPFAMNAYESITYLAAPFQTSLGVARSEPPGSDVLRHPLCTVTNGGFESGTRGWYAGSGNLFVASRRYVHSGGYSAASMASGANQLLAYHPVSFFPVAYTLHAWVRVPRSDKRQLSLALGGVRLTRGRGARTVDMSRRGVWQHVRIAFTPDQVYSAGDVRLVSDVRTPGFSKVFLDDVSLTAASLPSAGLLAGLKAYLVPTYFHVNTGRVNARESAYRCFVSVDPNNTTNSAFAIMYDSIGHLAFLLMGIIAFVAALGAGYAIAHGGYFMLAGYSLAYCFAELWRTYVFNAGIIHLLLFAFITIPFFHSGVRRLRRHIPLT